MVRRLISKAALVAAGLLFSQGNLLGSSASVSEVSLKDILNNSQIEKLEKEQEEPKLLKERIELGLPVPGQVNPAFRAEKLGHIDETFFRPSYAHGAHITYHQDWEQQDFVYVVIPGNPGPDKEDGKESIKGMNALSMMLAHQYKTMVFKLQTLGYSWAGEPGFENRFTTTASGEKVYNHEGLGKTTYELLQEAKKIAKGRKLFIIVHSNFDPLSATLSYMKRLEMAGVEVTRFDTIGMTLLDPVINVTSLIAKCDDLLTQAKDNLEKLKNDNADEDSIKDATWRLEDCEFDNNGIKEYRYSKESIAYLSYEPDVFLAMVQNYFGAAPKSIKILFPMLTNIQTESIEPYVDALGALGVVVHKGKEMPKEGVDFFPYKGHGAGFCNVLKRFLVASNEALEKLTLTYFNPHFDSKL